MNTFAALLRGFAIGLVTTIPVGPIALLCMRRTLDGGLLFGAATGIGAAFADALYGGTAAFGVVAVASFLEHHQTAFRTIGGIFMLVLAIRLIAKPPHVQNNGNGTGDRPASHAVGALVSGFLLTASNPMTMLGFAAVFASVGVGSATSTSREAGFLVLGIWTGSATWWLILTSLVARLSHLISDRALKRINLGGAVMLAGFGLYALVSAGLMMVEAGP